MTCETWYECETAMGLCVLRRKDARGLWEARIGGTLIKSYMNPQQAAEALAHGEERLADGRSTAALGVPDDIGRWAARRSSRR